MSVVVVMRRYGCCCGGGCEENVMVVSEKVTTLPTDNGAQSYTSVLTLNIGRPLILLISKKC